MYREQPVALRVQWLGRTCVVAVVFFSSHLSLPTLAVPHTVLGLHLAEREQEHISFFFWFLKCLSYYSYTFNCICGRCVPIAGSCYLYYLARPRSRVLPTLQTLAKHLRARVPPEATLPRMTWCKHRKPLTFFCSARLNLRRCITSPVSENNILTSALFLKSCI